MFVDLVDLKPYVSVLLCETLPRVQPGPVLGLVLDDVESMISESGRGQVVQRQQPKRSGKLQVGFLHYMESGPPAWLLKSAVEEGVDVQDTTNQLLVLCRRGSYFAIYASDPNVGRKLEALTQTGASKGMRKLRLIGPGYMNAAFVRGATRTLWLTGIHRTTKAKPDSKVLAGTDLRAALNPLGDQSYYFTAARSAHDYGAVQLLVGVTPRHSRVWAGPVRTWAEFAERISLLLERLESAQSGSPNESPLPVLATPVSDPGAVETPYDMSLVAPELLADEPIQDDELLQRAELWAYGARFDVEPTSGADFTAVVSVDGRSVGQLHFEFTSIAPNGSAGWNVSCSENPGELLLEAQHLCRDPRWLKVWYESGHTLSGGALFTIRHRDVRFESWQWATLNGIDVTKEKPHPKGKRQTFDPRLIGKSDSLFCWVQRSWKTPGSKKQQGWIACDDGAMEIADFVHYDPENPEGPILSLVHVKASHSNTKNRQVSTSDYEVVVGQAVKNIRSLDTMNLAEGLKSGAGKAVGWATWKNGRHEGNRNSMIAELNRRRSNYRRRVVVLQPRVTESEYARARREQEQGKETSRVRRMRQLDTLLLEAQSACRDLNAEFLVIGEKK
jgi:hypothetical protein